MKTTAIADWLRAKGRLIPLLGSLPDCSRENLRDAFYEVSAATIFATMPLWFLPIIGKYLFTNPISIDEGIKTGELFIYSAALSGPLVYVIMKRYGDFTTDINKWSRKNLPLTIQFPYGGWFVGISLIMCILSGFAFSFLKNPIFTRPEDITRINFAGIIELSWISFFVSTLVLFCVTAYKNMLENIARESQPRQEDEFYNRWMGEKE